MQYKVIKEFPGLKIGDTLILEENGEYYANTSEHSDVSVNTESVSINTIALSKEIVEKEEAYFQAVGDSEIPTSPLDEYINEMLQTAALLEADKVTAVNAYHLSIVDEMLSKIYRDANLLTELK